MAGAPNELAKFVADPRYGELDDAQRREAIAKLEPRFGRLNRFEQNRFVGLVEKDWRVPQGAEQTGLPPAATYAPMEMEETTAPTSLPGAAMGAFRDLGASFARGFTGLMKAGDPLAQTLEGGHAEEDYEREVRLKLGITEPIKRSESLLNKATGGGAAKGLRWMAEKGREGEKAIGATPLEDMYAGQNIQNTPGLWRDPLYLSHLTANALGSIASFAVQSELTGGAALDKKLALERAMPKVLAARPVLREAARLAPSTAIASGLETITDAADGYETAITQYGAQPEDALAVFSKVMREEGPLTFLTNLAGVYSPRMKGVKGKLANLGLDVGMEGGQELGQGVIQRRALNEKAGANIPLMQGGPEEAIGAGLAAAIFGGARSLAARHGAQAPGPGPTPVDPAGPSGPVGPSGITPGVTPEERAEAAAMVAANPDMAEALKPLLAGEAPVVEPAGKTPATPVVATATPVVAPTKGPARTWEEVEAGLPEVVQPETVPAETGTPGGTQAAEPAADTGAGQAGDALDQVLAGVPEAKPKAAEPTPPETPVKPDVAKGSVFELPSGKYTVTSINYAPRDVSRSRIAFVREDGDGQKTPGTMPVDAFLRMVTRPAETPAAEPEKPAIATEKPAPPQPAAPDALDHALAEVPETAPIEPTAAPEEPRPKRKRRPVPTPTVQEAAAEITPTLPPLKRRPFADAVEAHGRWEQKLLQAEAAGNTGSVMLASKMVDKYAAPIRKHLGENYQGALTAEEILVDARGQQAPVEEEVQKPVPPPAQTFNRQMADFGRRLSAVAKSRDVGELGNITKEMEAYRDSGAPKTDLDYRLINASIAQAHSTLQQVQKQPEKPEPTPTPAAAAAAPVSEDSLANLRTTPAPGTSERAKLEADYAAVDAASDANYEKRKSLEAEIRNSKWGSKKKEAAEKKLEKLREADSAAHDTREQLRKQVYMARLEDAATQTDNPVMQTAAINKLAEMREDDRARTTNRPRSEAESAKLMKRREDALESIETALSKRTPKFFSSTIQEIAKLSPEENAAAVKAAVKDVAQRFMEHPLTADNIDKTLAGALHAHRVAAYKEKAIAGLSPEEKATGISDNIGAAYEVEQIDGAVTLAKAEVEKKAVLEAAVKKDLTDARSALSRTVRPLSEVPVPKMNEQAGAGDTKVWDGNLAEAGEIVTDGHILIEAGAANKLQIARLRKSKTNKYTHGAETIRKVWAKSIESADMPLEEIGAVDTLGGSVAIFAKPDGTVVPLSAKRVRFIQSLTGATEVRGQKKKPGTTVVFYKDGKPVAGLAPRGKAPDIDVSIARQSASEAVKPEEQSGFDKAAAAARERLGVALTGETLSTGLDPAVLRDLAIVTAHDIKRIGVRFGAWSKRMVKAFGKAIKPKLLSVWGNAQRLHARYKASKWASERGAVSIEGKKAEPKAGPVFFSQLERAVSEKMPAKATAAQVRAIVSNPQHGVKADEVKWTGLDDFLAGKATVAKAEVLEHLRQNSVQVKEVLHGPGAVKPKYANEHWVLAGGEANRELLLTLPVEPSPVRNLENYNSYASARGYDAAKIERTWHAMDDPVFREWQDNNSAILQRNQEIRDASYKSAHWDEPNVLAHIRFNEREDVDGNRVLHIEEIQSDWHQEGRKKGYKTKAEPLSMARPGVPAAPFAKTWHELAFKRTLRWAAEHGFDKLTWTTGKQQAERYDLSKRIGRIEWVAEPVQEGDVLRLGHLYAWDLGGSEVMRKELAETEIEDYVGKDAAKKLLGQPVFTEMSRNVQELRGIDLQIGGEGMEGFYDRILPAFAAKYGKKWGAKVGTAKVEKTVEVHSIDVTPAMVESVLQGQPMFKLDNGKPTESLIVSEAVIQRALPGAAVTDKRIDEERWWFAEMPNGYKIAVRHEDRIPFNREDVIRAYGRDPAEGKGLRVLGKHTRVSIGSLIQLAKLGAGESTLRHEVFHAAMRAVLTDQERARLLKAHGSEEKAARAYESWDGHGAAPETWMGKILKFFRNFFARVFQRPEAIFGKLRDGEVWNRAVRPMEEQGTLFMRSVRGRLGRLFTSLSYHPNMTNRDLLASARIARLHAPQEKTPIFLANVQAVDLILRMATGETVNAFEVGGYTLAAPVVSRVAEAWARKTRLQFNKKEYAALSDLVEAIQEAAGHEAELIVIRDHWRTDDAGIKKAIREELDHVLQAKLAKQFGYPDATGHVTPEFSEKLLSTTAGEKAERNLGGVGYGKSQRNPNELVGEIGVRLMRRARHSDLGLAPSEVLKLAQAYGDGLLAEAGGYANEIIDAIESATGIKWVRVVAAEEAGKGQRTEGGTARSVQPDFSGSGPVFARRKSDDRTGDREVQRDVRNGSDIRPELHAPYSTGHETNGGRNAGVVPSPDQEHGDGGDRGGSSKGPILARGNLDRTGSLFDEAPQGRVEKKPSAEQAGLFSAEEERQSKETERQYTERLQKQQAELMFNSPLKGPGGTPGGLFDTQEDLFGSEKGAASPDLFGADRIAQVYLRGAELFGAGLRTFSAWRTKMVEEFGPGIRTKALGMWATVKEFWNDESGSLDLTRLVDFFERKSVAPIQALKDIRDTFAPIEVVIGREGAAGARIKERLDEARIQGKTTGGWLLLRIQRSGLTKMDDTQAEALVNAMRGTGPEVDGFAANRAVTDWIASTAEGLGAKAFTSTGRRDFHGRENYYPQKGLWVSDLRSGKKRNNVRDWNLIKLGWAKTEKEAETLIDEYADFLDAKTQNPKTLLEKMLERDPKLTPEAALKRLLDERLAVKRHGALEHAREWDSPFYDPDPRRVLPLHAASAAMRLAEIAQFGQENEQLAREVLKIAKAGGDWKAVHKHLNSILGWVEESQSRTERIGRWVRAFNVMKLSSAAIANSVQVLWNGPKQAGFFPTLRGLYLATRKEGREFGLESGADIERILRHSSAVGMGTRWVEGILKLYGFTQTESFNRISAANVGKVYADRMLAKLLKRQSIYKRERLAELGVDVDAALKRGELSHKDELRAGLRMSEMINFRADAASKTEFGNTAVGKVMLQFQGFGYEQTRFAVKTLRDLAHPGKRPEHFREALLDVFVMALWWPVLGGLIRLAKDAVWDREPKEDASLAETAWRNVQAAGGLGVAADYADAAGGYGRVAGRLIGPTGGMVAEGAEALAAGTPEKIARFGVRQIPFGGPLDKWLLAE